MRPIRAIDVVWFNIPTYLAAVAMVIASVAIVSATHLPEAIRVAFAIGGGIAAWWSVASFAAAAWVFDRHEYGSLVWVRKLVKHQTLSSLNLTAGFDATTAVLKGALPRASVIAVDVFEPAARHDGPLLRARQSRPPPNASIPPGATLAIATRSVDVVTMLMSAHELEGDDVQSRVLAEITRILRPDGRLVVAEFLRNPLNLLVFGPGALHFHTREQWLEVLAAAEFRVLVERRITPFVGLFVAGPASL